MIVTDKSDADWWEGYNEVEPSKVGFFPASFVEMFPAAAAAAAAAAVDGGGGGSVAGSPTASVLASSDGLERATVTFDYEAEDE